MVGDEETLLDLQISKFNQMQRICIDLTQASRNNSPHQKFRKRIATTNNQNPPKSKSKTKTKCVIVY